MALIQKLHLEHLPESQTVNVALFRSVTNASFLHQQLLSGNTDFEYAFIDASIITSRTHALAAVFRAVNDLLEGRLRTRNVHSEIVFCLSPTNNIAESFRRFGISPTTRDLLVIKVASNPDLTASTIQQHLSASIQGTQTPFEDDVLAETVDWAKVRKYYKLSALGGGKVGGLTMNGNAGPEWQKEMEMHILGAMALRGMS